MDRSRLYECIKRYKCESYADFYTNVPAKIYKEFALSFGTFLEREIALTLSIYIKEELDHQRNNLLSIVVAKPHGNPKLIHDLLLNIGIDPLEFALAVINVLNKSLPKKNCIFIYGPVNSCKTILAQCITYRLITCYATNHGSLGDFYFAPFLNKAIINLEELQVTCATADDYKSILGGAPLDINRKHIIERQRLTRVPIIITSNYDKFGRGMIPGLDEEALQERCFRFHTLKNYAPPCPITHIDFSAWLSNYA